MGDLSGGNKSTVIGVAVMCVSVRVVRRAERVHISIRMDGESS